MPQEGYDAERSQYSLAARGKHDRRLRGHGREYKLAACEKRGAA
jgi:hypothetical protein